MIGKFKARAVGETVIGTSSKAGTPFFQVYFQITEGEFKGEEVMWKPHFSDTRTKGGKGKSVSEIIIESLFTCGWKTDDGDISAFSDGKLHGIDANEVVIVVDEETHTTDEGEERTRPRVQWVNKVGGFLDVENKMKPTQAKAFGDRMRGLALKLRPKTEAAPMKRTGTDDYNNGSDDDIPF